MAIPMRFLEIRLSKKHISVEVQSVNEPILKVENIHTFIGKHHILQGVSFEAMNNAVTVLMGRNGAGKSTVLKAVMGILSSSVGRIIYKGEEISEKKSYEIARKGIVYVPEDRGLFSKLTVGENIRLAILREKDRTVNLRAEKALNMFPDLKRFWNSKAEILSGGQKQMLTIARAVVSDADLSLLDEPSKGLAPILVDLLADTIEKIKEHTTVILVEQNFYMASRVGDNVCILNDGMSVYNDVMEALVHDDGIKSRYLGVSKTDNPNFGNKTRKIVS
jgi:branched-chain amino acid transport system ATP-binding protein